MNIANFKLEILEDGALYFEELSEEIVQKEFKQSIRDLTLSGLILQNDADKNWTNKQGDCNEGN